MDAAMAATAQGVPRVWSWVFGACFVATALHVVVGFALFVGRRHKHPIRGHSVPLIGMIAISAVHALQLAIVYMRIEHVELSCWAYAVFGYGTLLASWLTYIVRAWRIHIFYHLQTHKLNFALAAAPLLAKFTKSKKKKKKLSMSSDSDEVAARDEVTRNEVEVTAAAAAKNLYLWCTERNFFLVAAVASIVALLGECIPVWMEPGKNGQVWPWFNPDQPDLCASMEITHRITQAIIAFAIVILAYTAWKLRNSHDGFSIKAEMKYCALWGVLSLVSMMMVDQSVGSVEAWQLVMIITTNLILYNAITVKVLASFGVFDKKPPTKTVGDMGKDGKSLELEAIGDAVSGEQPQTLHRSNTKSVSVQFREVLDDPPAKELFTEHLKREWSVENILFYNSVNAFRAFCEEGRFESPAERLQMAEEIYRTYITDDATSMVNLPSTIRNVLLEKMEGFLAARENQNSNDARLEDGISEVPADLFDAAAENIFNLMKTDSFVRFQVSAMFVGFLKDDGPAEAGGNSKTGHVAFGFGSCFGSDKAPLASAD